MSENAKPTFRQKAVDLWNYFTTYEKVWFFSILILSFIFAFIFPEEDVNGVNGKIIMALYLLDTFLNILCELLIRASGTSSFRYSLSCVRLRYALSFPTASLRWRQRSSSGFPSTLSASSTGTSIPISRKTISQRFVSSADGRKLPLSSVS